MCVLAQDLAAEPTEPAEPGDPDDPGRDVGL
ncbi:hypothetical protein BJ982_004695 [Sphaerisporangium siamense]|uniref:Uncharacterized protein n=1 Tax=Sphaerisporangium siamense TaxID=795645 RepID=A0A7W7GDM0_9ACTN|nr:hypothetical protein [Sphaerisporangium siamense]